MAADAREPRRWAVSPLTVRGCPLGCTDRARRDEHSGHRLVSRVASGPDLLRRRKLDRVGPLTAADLIQLLVGRPVEPRVFAPPVIKPARRLSKAAHQRDLALLQRSRVLSADPRPPVPNLLGAGAAR